ncbi:MAG: SDR family NAD(P)-dependent oxidoreductase [Planctomycetota bacterium]
MTGGGTGIGRATAELVLSRGGSVVLNGRREAVLADAARALDPTGARVAVVAGDVADPATSLEVVRVAEERFGGLDVFVNNAGYFVPTGFEDHGPEDFRGFVDTILAGTFYGAQAAVPALKRRGGGAIVNVGSMWAERAIGATPSSAYSAAKAGVHALTRNLAIELADASIRVNAVAPAVVETPVYGTFMTPEEVREVLPTFGGLHPVGRNAQPEEVAEAILFLASPASSFVTGSILPVDGGVLAGQGAS